MSYLFPNSEIVSIDYVEKLSEDEDIENIIHATPIQDNNQISILPLVVVEKNIKYKYRIISTSVILCCFSIIIITIAVSTLNRNNYNSSKNSINNSTSYSYK